LGGRNALKPWQNRLSFSKNKIGEKQMNDIGFRRFLLTLLDDENGIREDAYNMLDSEIEKHSCDDIRQAVECTDGRCYIGEDFADEELAKLNG
jgi:hypothetical protein